MDRPIHRRLLYRSYFPIDKNLSKIFLKSSSGYPLPTIYHINIFIFGPDSYSYFDSSAKVTKGGVFLEELEVDWSNTFSFSTSK